MDPTGRRGWWRAVVVTGLCCAATGAQPAADAPGPAGTDRAPIGEAIARASGDGEVVIVRCENPDPRFFDESRHVIFINGMGNDPDEHWASARALSELEQCPVLAILNATSGTARDLGQSIADAWQFSRPAPGEPAEAFETMCRELEARGDRRTRGEIMRGLLSRNAAAGSLFDALTDPALAEAPIYAHSQGNLIAANVLRGIEIALGPEAIAGRRVHSFGSPSRAWPRGIVRTENSFAFDPVTWMGRSKKLRVARVVVPTEAPWYWPFAHSLRVYLEHDAAFVVNRRRLGGLHVSASMNERGLARDLFDMGRNMPRIDAVVRYLETEHRGNVDDVVRAYADLLRDEPAPAEVLDALRAREGLAVRMIEAMERGFTSDREDRAIEFLRGLRGPP